jgi:2-isopropylmalate synthase
MRDDNPKSSLARSRALRRSMTVAEAKLWQILRSRRLQNLKFRRQVPIGVYIVDFVCLSAGLVVEADGSHHSESAYDARRDAYLQAQGYRVLRFWNADILVRTKEVTDTICAACGLDW